jgi:hypothetical protein
VRPGWDWCWSCGYDPEGLRADPAAQLAPRSWSPPAAFQAPSPFAPPGAPTGSPPPVPGPPAAASLPPIEPPPPFGALPPTGPPPMSTPPPGAPTVRPAGRDLTPLAIAAAVIAVVAIVAVALATRGHPAVKVGAAAPASTLPPVTTATAPPAAPAQAPVLGSSTDPSVAVSPAEANDVASRLWQARMTARYQRDAATLKLIEDGPALEADLGYICNLGCHGQLEKAVTTTVNLPLQTSWPVHFFATVTNDLPDCPVAPCDESFVAEQVSSGAPWKIVLYASYSGTVYAAQPVAGAGGFAVPPDPSPLRDFRNLPNEYAQYLQSLKDTGRPPVLSRLGPGAFTSDLARNLYDPPSKQQAQGVLYTTTYFVSPTDPVWSFAGAYDVQVTCGTVRFRVTDRPLPGQELVQPTDQSAYGAAVAPGSYSAVLVQGLHTVCFEGYNQPPGKVLVFGTWGDVTQVTGTPAKPAV